MTHRLKHRRHSIHRLHLRCFLPLYFVQAACLSSVLRLVFFRISLYSFYRLFPCLVFILFRTTTDLHVPTISTFAAGMFMGNFAIFRHVTQLSTSPTFALPWLLSIRSFIAFTSVFPVTIHSIFANKNHGILIVI